MWISCVFTLESSQCDESDDYTQHMPFEDKIRQTCLNHQTKGFVRLCAGFVRLCAGFVRLCAGFVRLCAGFVRLCAGL